MVFIRKLLLFFKVIIKEDFNLDFWMLLLDYRFYIEWLYD